jgi:hypothetical protein
VPAVALSRVVESGPDGQRLAADAWQRLEVLPGPRSPQARIYPLACLIAIAAADPDGQGGRVGVAVAGDQVDDLDGLLALLRDRAAQLRDLGGAVELDPGRRQRGLDGAAGAAAVARAHGRDGGNRGPGQLPQLLVKGWARWP